MNSQPSQSAQLSPTLWLVAIILVSAGLKFLNIDYTSLWLDEIYTLMVANGHLPPEQLESKAYTAQYLYTNFLAWQPLKWERLVELLTINVHTPLYYLLINPWLGWFGNHVTGLRSFSALLTCLTLLPLYALGKAMKGPRFALLAVFIMAFSPMQIYFAQEGRMYALSLFFATLSALGLWKTLHSQHPVRWCLFYTLALLGGAASHYMFLFFVVFQVVYACIDFFKKPQARHALFVIPALVLDVAAWLWMPVFLAQLSGVNSEYHFAKGAVDFTRYLEVFVWQPLVMAAGDNKLVRLFYMPLTVALFLGYAWMVWKKKVTASFSREGFLLLWMQVPLLVQVIYDLLTNKHTSVIDRYALLIAPAVYFLMALALEQLLQSRWKKTVALPVLGAILALAAGMVMAPSPLRDEHNKKDNRAKLEFMASQAQPQDLLLVNGPFGAPLIAAYYVRQQAPEQPILYWVRTYNQIEYPLPSTQVLAPYERIWLFKYRATELRGREDLEAYLNTHYQRQSQGKWPLYVRKQAPKKAP